VQLSILRRRVITSLGSGIAGRRLTDSTPSLEMLAEVAQLQGIALGDASWYTNDAWLLSRLRYLV